MNKYEVITTIISSTAIIVSMLSLIFSKINMNKIEKADYGQCELSIRESITSAKNRITDILYSKDIINSEYTNQRIKIATEQLLNAYEEACAKYIDSKIDKKRFKITYTDEIKNIVECDFKEYFQFGSKYSAIKKVYSEWFMQE